MFGLRALFEGGGHGWGVGDADDAVAVVGGELPGLMVAEVVFFDAGSGEAGGAVQYVG